MTAAELAGFFDGGTAFKVEEMHIIRALRVRLKRVQQKLTEVQTGIDQASVTANQERNHKEVICDQQWRGMLEMERLQESQKEDSERQRALREELEEVQEELRNCVVEEHVLGGVSQEDHDELRRRILQAESRLREVRSESGELRQHLVQVLARPHLDLPRPAWDLNPWDSTAGSSTASPVTLSPSSSIGRTSSFGCRSASGSSDLKVRSSAETRRRSSCSATPRSSPWNSPASEQKARIDAEKLIDENRQLEAKVQRERDRTASLTQRLETLRQRGRQLELSLGKAREVAAEREAELKSQLQTNAQRMRDLVDLALATLASLPLSDDLPSAANIPAAETRSGAHAGSCGGNTYGAFQVSAGTPYNSSPAEHSRLPEMGEEFGCHWDAALLRMQEEGVLQQIDKLTGPQWVPPALPTGASAGGDDTDVYTDQCGRVAAPERMPAAEEVVLHDFPLFFPDVHKAEVADSSQGPLPAPTVPEGRPVRMF